VSQKGIETILTRQLASYLAVPIFIVDTEGTLIFFNEPAEPLLGLRYDETGEMSVDQLSSVFQPRTEQGALMPTDDLPLVIALRESRPVQSRFWIEGLDKVTRHLEVTAFPLIGQSGRKFGAVAMFWETQP
jgi:hypothetical protein